MLKLLGIMFSITVLLLSAVTPQSHPVRAQVSAENNCVVDLTFDQDSVLPSSQGLTYFSDPGAVPENSIFSVSGGMLHLNSFGTGAATYYMLPNVYDSNKDFVLEFRMKVFPGTGIFGLYFEASDAVTDFELGFTDSGISLPPPPNSRPFLPFTTTDAFHVYKLTGTAGSTTYQLFVDGVLVASNAVSGGDPASRFAFGDGTTSGGDGQAEIDYVRYCLSEPITVVQIDIKPGSFPNSINPRSKGVIPVAILSTNTFNAATVNPTSVHFGAAGTEATPVHYAQEDVNLDGNMDLIFHFRTQETGIQCGAINASLTGNTLSGQMIKGVDSVNTVGC